MARLWRVAPVLVVGMVWGGFLMGDDKKEPIIVSARLPNYYSRLGLTAKQKNEILKIRGKYAAEIQELKQKISELMDQQDAECEKVLTSTQRDRLKEMLGNPGRRKTIEDEDAPVNVDKKKAAASKDKSKDTPSEIKK